MDSKKTALSAMMSALGAVLLYFSSVVQAGSIALCAAAGLMPAAARKSHGAGYGWLVYLCITVLGWIFAPNKIYAAAFMFCFGLYPLLKFDFEKIGLAPAAWAVKLIFANAVFFAVCRFFGEIFMIYSDMMKDNRIIFVLLFNVVFIVYDVGVSRLMLFYESRIEKNIT